ncbi:MAG TPA: GNAT family N-acetyltransferase [Rhabdochlamydiaceae bacterium]|nr:GNAT family N-acetyltransferase [Rhabdochlamydiaceae bacterium]
MLHIDPLTMLEEALDLVRIRNQCRQMMTNDQHEITLDQQKKWFETFYTKQMPQRYRVWLLKEEKIIGYFAAKEGDEGFYITEGIQENSRGKGAGSFLLQTMVNQKNLWDKHLFVDIFDNNLASIRLHQKCGFVPFEKFNSNTTRYYLRR